MTEQPKHNALVAFAALTALLAKYPELADGYDAWTYDAQTGITVRQIETDDLTAFNALASALDCGITTGHVFEYDGKAILPHYLNAEIAGIRVFSSLHLRVDQNGAAS